MQRKKLFLTILLCFTSGTLGYTLGTLDVFGFLNGQHVLNLTVLLVSFILWYILLFTVFLLDFGSKKNLVLTFLMNACLFGLLYFVVSTHFVVSFVSILLFFMFLWGINSYVESRLKLFIKFAPYELFQPVMKGGFTALMIFVSLLGAFQTQNAVKKLTLISPSLLVTVTKPIVKLVNSQLSSQLSSQLTQFPIQTPSFLKQQVTQKTVEQLFRVPPFSFTKTIFDIDPSQIPYDKLGVSAAGLINIGPVVDSIIPTMAHNINLKLIPYAAFIPFVILILIILALQPFVFMFEFFMSVLTPLLFNIFLLTRFIRVEKEMVEREVVVL